MIFFVFRDRGGNRETVGPFKYRTETCYGYTQCEITIVISIRSSL